ncbi:MAG: UbiD family decarboxylase, partial [Salinibacterium sp.]|nr:UbiD family decarboxylase [Salinibacterium sp.]
MSKAFEDLGSFVDALRQEGELVEIETLADPRLEIPEIHRRVIAAGGPALLFRQPKGSDFPVVTNLFGTARRVEMAFGSRPRDFVAEIARLPEELMPPSPGKIWQKRGLFRDLLRVGLKTRRKSPVEEVVDSPAGLDRLPALTTWSQDGGPFITLPLVYTQHPDTGGHNLGMYRMQVHDAEHTGMHFQIGKG